MAQTPLRTAIVGLGWWSTPIGNAAKRSAKIDLALCYTRNPEKRAAFAEKHGCAQAESFEAVCADPDIEGVLLTTPNSAHAEQVEALLRAGKHVWVEKPITNTVAQAGPVLEAWRASGKVLAVGHCYRRAAGHRKMRALIDDGTVGRPLWAEASFTNHMGLFLTPDKWRFHKDECPGGPLMQMGIHHCDTLQYLLGEAVRVTGVHKRLATPAEIPDVTLTIIEHEGGAVSNLTTSFVTPGVYNMRLHGTEAVLQLEMVRENLTFAERTNAETTLAIQKQGEAGWTPVPLPDTPDMALDQLDDFADCVRGGGAPETGPREALYAMAVVEPSVRSAESGRPVEIGALLNGLEA
ncbi:MAG: Gfo/Idh/MocA family oxidoreductase [bacterium]